MYTTRLIFSRLIVTAATTVAPPAGFTYIHPFLNKKEQLILTKAALTHLDNVGSSAARRKLKRLLAAGTVTEDELGFLPEDQCYQFEEVSERDRVSPSRNVN
jgi:hypothetical protein